MTPEQTARFETQQAQWRTEAAAREARERANIHAFFCRIHGSRLTAIEFEDRCYMRRPAIRAQYTVDATGVVHVTPAALAR